MADDPAPAIINRAQTASVGQTGLVSGATTDVAGLLNWLFQCHEAGEKLTPHQFFSLVTPDQTTLFVMAAGLILIGHSLKNISLPGGQKRRRATDTQGTTP